MKNKTTITVEIWNQTVVRKDRAAIALCQFCGTKTQMVTPDEAAFSRKTTTREIYRHIENGTFHFIETTDGALFVCRKSLQEHSGPLMLRPNND